MLFQKIRDYNISSIRYSSEDLSVYTGFIGDLSSKKMFIINKFNHNEKNKKIFQELFLYFLSKERTMYFKDFFSIGTNFYAVFDYHEGQNILYKYNKKLCISNFEERTKVFESVCVKISNYLSKKAPQVIIDCSMNPANIVVDDKLDVLFNFNMKSVYTNLNVDYYGDNKLVIKEMYNIFKVFFEVERASKYNQIIKFISKKCELGIYKVIPEIVIELKNKYGEASISSFVQFWKYQFNVRKKIIIRYVNISFTLLLIVSFVMVINKKIRSNYNGFINNSLSIGEINYSSTGNDSSDKSISIGSTSITPKVAPKKSVSIPKGSDVEYDDYIIKRGDTVSSITEKCYGDKSLSNVITSFNDLLGHLIPGTIIKIPSKSYVQNNSESK